MPIKWKCPKIGMENGEGGNLVALFLNRKSLKKSTRVMIKGVQSQNQSQRQAMF